MVEIKVLGTGCPKCKALYKSVSEVVSEMGIDADIKKIEQINEIVAYGVMLTPGLVINGKVKATGKVPGKTELKKHIDSEM
jgi:small redox-active disulfide protein 2